ncbi:MAG: hypothetical protein KGL39_13290 [Patescibacteria group bacterium]|nr:hypothetical protein [Patescibacteria group bacterium]
MPYTLKKPPSATLTPESGSRALNQPSCALVRLKITESQAAKIGILREWRRIYRRREHILARRMQFQTELAALLQQLNLLIQREEWSEREMQKHTGLNRSAWRRIRSGRLSGRKAISRLKTALKLV